MQVQPRRKPFVLVLEVVDIVLDERFCDGFYFVKALDDLKKMYNDPSSLTRRLEDLPTDVDVIHPGA